MSRIATPVGCGRKTNSNAASATVPGVRPGQAYGYRMTGPFAPARGLRFNPAKLLLDPYARAIEGQVRFGPEVLGYAAEDPTGPVRSTPRPTCRAAWSSTRRSLGAMRHDHSTPVPTRSSTSCTSQGLHRGPPVPFPSRCGAPTPGWRTRALAHLQALGVTTVKLLPVHHNVPEAFPAARGLTNYWGYNTIGYFAPHAAIIVLRGAIHDPTD